MSELIDIVRCHRCNNRAIVAGLCAGCASKEIKRLRESLRGAQDNVTRQIEAVKDAEREIKRLRKIEAALLLPWQVDVDPRKAAITWYRKMALYSAGGDALRAQRFAMADALEGKP